MCKMGRFLNSINVLYFALLLFFLAAFVFALPRRKRNQKKFQLLVWCGIILGTVFIYSTKDAILNSSFFANLVPGHGYNIDKNTIAFKKSNDGHFYIVTKINNATIIFLVDTGASDVVLTRSDAQKIGIDIRSLNYTRVYNTANGRVYAAPIMLGAIKIKNLEVHNIRASVSSSDALGQSLLGMSLLEHFTFSINDETLMITH